jgi:hypothetical protein
MIRVQYGVCIRLEAWSKRQSVLVLYREPFVCGAINFLTVIPICLVKQIYVITVSVLEFRRRVKRQHAVRADWKSVKKPRITCSSTRLVCYTPNPPSHRPTSTNTTAGVTTTRVGLIHLLVFFPPVVANGLFGGNQAQWSLSLVTSSVGSRELLLSQDTGGILETSRKRFSPSHGGICFQRGSTCHTDSVPSRYTKSSLDVFSTILRTRFTLADSTCSSRYPVFRLFDSPTY